MVTEELYQLTERDTRVAREPFSLTKCIVVGDGRFAGGILA